VILFLAIATLLAALALAFLLPPLLRARAPAAAAAREEANAAIYREQLAELDTELARGAMSEEAYALARRELERRIVAESQSAALPASAGTLRHRSAAIAVAMFLPLAVSLGYWQFGNPAALLGTAVPDTSNVTPEQMRELTERLWERMHAAPEDPQGWILLGRSLAVFGDHERAAQAYARAAALVPADAGLLADYADALAMVRGRKLAGEPFALVKRALEIDPEHVKALALAGTAEFERGDNAAAIAYWTRVLRQVPPDSEFARSVGSSIEEARRLAGTPTAQAELRLEGTVSLDPALAARVGADDTVFVIARPTSGARMPLAVARTTVGKLPYSFTLDDSMAMAPGASISGQSQVVVAARVSKSGNAAPQKGDIEGVSNPVAPGAKGIAILMSRVID
jgi:cytochrome c-type biogenesis protein CcmH